MNYLDSAVYSFWNIGPQDTLYVPGPWLKNRTNEIIIFDMLPTSHESVTGLDHPILNAPVSDQTTSSQQEWKPPKLADCLTRITGLRSEVQQH